MAKKDILIDLILMKIDRVKYLTTMKLPPKNGLITGWKEL